MQSSELNWMLLFTRWGTLAGGRGEEGGRRGGARD